MILKMNKSKIKVGLDLTKEIKKSKKPIIQGEVNPDMDKIKEASKNIGLEVVKSCEKVNESHIDDEVYDKIILKNMLI